MTSKTSSSKNKKIRYIVILILLFFFIVNLFNIYKKDLFVDESITYNIVNKVSFIEIVKGIDVHPPLYYLLMKILPHNNIYILRFYSLVIITFSIYLLFLFTYKYFKNKKISFIVLFMSVLSMTISEYATQARMYSLLFLLSVLILYSFLNKMYDTTLSLIIISLFVHYYSIFLLIPYILTLASTGDKQTFWKYMTKTALVVFVSLIILSPVIYRQFFSENNPYKIPPPHDRPTLVSLPSMLIFPFIIPSNINTLMMFGLSFIIIFIIIYLVLTYNSKYLYLKLSFITSILIFILAFIFNIPFHHRYIIIFFPMIYLLLSLSIESRVVNMRYAIYVFFLVFLVMTFVSYHQNPKNQFVEISKTIECPKNILHETPFSFLPMSIYLPNCNHYMAKDIDWTELTHETLYTTEDKINNYNISYDIYFHYFDEFKVPNILDNTNLTTLQLIKVKD